MNNLTNELNNFDLTGEILDFPFIDENEIHDLGIAAATLNKDSFEFCGEWSDCFSVLAGIFNKNVNPKRSS